MKPIIEYNPDITQFFGHFLGEDMVAITLYPYIFTSTETVAANVLNHEKIHCEQYKELLIIGFPIVMLFNFLFNLIYYGDKNISYRQTLFEREAYENMNNFDYLKYRRRYSWLWSKKIA